MVYSQPKKHFELQLAVAGELVLVFGQVGWVHLNLPLLYILFYCLLDYLGTFRK
jgi:hypothetical protein